MWPALMLFAAALPVSPTILATCGASSGTGYYVIDGKGSWHDDTISDGKMTFSMEEGTRAAITYFDTFRGVVSVASDGGNVTLNDPDDKTGEFAMLVHYPLTGVTETYSVLRLANGKRQVLWTQNKAHVGPGGRVSSAKVLTADCD